MKKFILILKQKSWLIAIFIFILALILRIIAAFKIAWRPDEIVYVDWIGTWFAKYFWQYLFQLKHHLYPPASPIFGNPPLAMWFLSFGVWLALKFHFSVLIGARLINVLIGSLSALLLFNLGKKWFNLRTGILAGLAFALLPLAITNNATAYLETPLVLLVIIQIELIFNYLKLKKTKYLYLLGIVFGLSLLVKLTVFILVISFIILIPIVLFKNKKFKNFWLSYLAFLLIIIATPLILWSGFRDIDHLKNMYMLYTSKTYSPFILNYSFPIFRYYYLMMIGVLAPVLVIGLLLKIITFFRDLIRKGLEKNQKLFFVVIPLLIYLAYNGIATRYGAPHQLLPIIPLVILSAALGLGQIVEYFPNRFIKRIITVGIVICLVLPLTAFKPAFWGLYSSILVGGTNNAFKLYPVGIESEAVPLIADYLNRNGDKDSRTAIMAYDWTLKKYLNNNRSTASLFLTEGKNAGLSQAADYLVLPRIYSEGNIGLTAQELLKDKPVEIIQVKGIELARIYRADYSKIQFQKQIAIGLKDDWRIKKINNNPNFKIEDETLKIEYSFTKFFRDTDLEDNRFLLTNNHPFLIEPNSRGVYLEVLGDGNDKLCSVVLSGENNNYFVNDFECDWQGWKKIYLPLEMFKYSPEGSQPNFDKLFLFSFSVVSRKPITGEIMIKNIHLANLKDDENTSP